MPSLEQQLLEVIQRDGPIPFSRFMETALYDPLHGYYASGRARIGKAGDFITAVSTGPLFGRLLARQFQEMWQLLDCPQHWVLVEQGAFGGELCNDVLSSLKSDAPDCFAATHIHIIEPFSCLQARQALKLKAFRNRVTWHRSSDSLPHFRGVHYSNELLDAFPVDILRREASGWQELRVCQGKEGLTLEPFPIEKQELLEAASTLPDAESGFTVEVNRQCGPWLKQIHEKLTDGWLLTFDYGMSQPELLSPQRRSGTLSAYRGQQREHSIMARPGEQDLTAHVNFTAVVRQARAHGWQVAGYTDQHRFFTGLAALHFQDKVRKLSGEEQKELLAFKTLSHPQLMGFQFKALLLSCFQKPTLSGFQYAGSLVSTLDA